MSARYTSSFSLVTKLFWYPNREKLENLEFFTGPLRRALRPCSADARLFAGYMHTLLRQDTIPNDDQDS